MYTQYIPVVQHGKKPRSAFTKHGMLFGTAADLNVIYGERGKLIEREFNSITPEACMKMNITQPLRRSVYNLEKSDILMAWARERGIKVHGHTLLWKYAVPDWVLQYAGNANELRAILGDHILTLVTHYADIDAWDVVNEMYDIDTGEYVRSIWSIFDAPTFALQHVKMINPLVQRYYNQDFGRDGWRRRVLDLARSRLIEGVGIQMHTWIGRTGLDQLKFFVDALGDLGVRWRISEMDVRLMVPPTLEDLRTQASIYKEIAGVCVNYGMCDGLTVWGTDDLVSWVRYTYDDYGAALLFDEDLRPKPAYHALSALT